RMSEHHQLSTALSLKATLLGGVATPFSTLALAATLPGPVTPPGPLAFDSEGMLDETIAAGSLDETIAAGSPSNPSSPRVEQTTQAGRSTVLPRRKPNEQSPELEAGARPRFDRVRLLGKGGMGEVELARDNDIRRTVAVKRLI